MDSQRNDSVFRSAELAELARAATQLVSHLRQIKILVFVYAFASLSISIGASLHLALTLDRDDDEHETAEELAAAGEGEPDALSAGDALPPISLPDADGRIWTNRDLNGRAVLLNFWATWCKPCRHEMPIFEEMQANYGTRGFTVLAVSVDDEGWDAVRPYIEVLEPSYPVVVADATIQREFGSIDSIPVSYFVHRDGTIHTKHVGALTRAHIIKDIEALLAREGPAPSDSSRDQDLEPASAESVARPAPEAKAARVENSGLAERPDRSVRSVGNGVSSPRLLERVEPSYTQDARDAKLTGTVELKIEIWEDGSVHNIEVVRGLGMGLDESAAEAVKQWKFAPGEKGGQPVRASARIRVKFNLR